MARKPHVRGPSQEVLLDTLRETGGGELPTIAEYFGVSEATIRRIADGLVYQGKLRAEAGSHGSGGVRMPKFYQPAGPQREVQPGA